MPGIYLIKDTKFNDLYEHISQYINYNFNADNSNFFHERGIKKDQDPQLTQLKNKFEHQAILSNPPRPHNFFVVDRHNKNSLLHKACKDGNNLLIRFLLNAGLNINQLNTFHESPLYVACLYQKEETVDLLLDSGANCNTEFSKKSPLYITLEPEIEPTQSEKIIAANILKKLINRGVNINQRLGSHSQFVPIHYAVMDRRELLVKTILDSEKADLSLTDVDGKTALHMVADYRNREEQYEELDKIHEEKRIVELLIPHVTSINKQEKWGNTPLHSAVINSNLEVVKAIITKDYLFPQEKILNIKNNKGRTALHEAVLETHRGPEILNLLVQLATQDELTIRSDVIQNGRVFVDQGYTALEMANHLLVEFQHYPQLSNELEIIKASLIDLQQIPISQESRSIFYNAIAEIKTRLEQLENFRFEKINDRIKELSLEAFDFSINALLPHISFSEMKSQLHSLSGKVDALKGYISININSNYQQALIKAKKTLEQVEYFIWKNNQLNLPSSFPELQHNIVDPNLLQAANHKYFQAHSFFKNNSLEDAKKYFKESIELYDGIKNYISMEEAYEFLALAYINTGGAKQYEEVNHGILFASKNDKAKLHAHLALAGFYKSLKKHNLGQLFPISNDILYAYESYHYSEAYKFTQGNLDNQAHIVLQREIGVGNKIKLGTYNIQQCIAIVAHDPQSDKVVLAHFDRFSGPIKFIDNILREFPNKSKIDLYLTGARDRRTTVSPSSTTTISDNNINQVFKQIFSNRHRFNLLATDVGDKLSPEAVVFNFIDKKLEHKMPHRIDLSLNSRAAMMSVQIGQKSGDYLLPLEKINFNLDAFSRIKVFSPNQQQLIEQKLQNYKGIIDAPEAWKHNQLIQPLLAMKQVENNLMINYEQGLFTNLVINENIFIKQPPFDREAFHRQQQRLQNTDFIHILSAQNLLSPPSTSFSEINTQGIEDDLENINIQPPRKKVCSRGIQKRELALCSIYVDELKKFIVNKQEMNYENSIINSDLLPDYLKTSDADKRSELLEFFESFRITGTKQFVLERLFSKEKLKLHSKKANKISSGFINGLLYEGVLTDLLHGNSDSAVQLGGLYTFNHILNQVSNKLNILSQSWITQGKWLRGQFLRVSTPFLSRSTSLFNIFNIVQDIKLLKSTNNNDQYAEAVVDMVSNDVYVGVDLIETGVEIAETSFESLAVGISSVTGPIGEIVAGIVLLGDRIYEAVEKVKHENELIKLTGWEKFKEGFLGFLNIKPEAYLQKEIDETTEYNNQILPNAWDWLIKHEEFKYIILPAIAEIGQRSRSVKVRTTCTYGDRIFIPCLVSQTTQEPIFAEIKDNRAYFHRKLFGFWQTQQNIKAPLGSELFCLPKNNPGTGQYVNQNQPDYLCAGTIALKKINGTGKAFFNLKTGTDYIAGFENVSNVMIVNDGEKDYEGGNQADLFILDAKKVTGIALEGNKGGIDGRGGEDTLSLQEFRPNANNLTVDFREEKLKYADLTLEMVSIEKLIGGSIPSSIIAACDTREIHTEGNADSIFIPPSECRYGMKMYLKPNITVENSASKGDFTYSIFTKTEGNIYVNLDVNQGLYDHNDDQLLTHQFLFNDSFLNISHISLDFPQLVPFTKRLYRIRFHLLNTQTQRLLQQIESASIIKLSQSDSFKIYYQFRSNAKPTNNEIYHLPDILNKTQISEIFNEKDISLHYQDWNNLNITLTNQHHIQQIVLTLLEDSHSSLFKGNPVFEVKTYLTKTLSFHFLGGETIKIGNKNVFLFHNSAETVETILSTYKPIAQRLNLISIIRTENNESIIIGHKGHEAMNYNPDAFKTHLDGNGGESLFVIDARPPDLRTIPRLPPDLRNLSNGLVNLGDLSILPLNEVILYHGYDRQVNTLDLRPLVAQFQTEAMDRIFKLLFVPPAEENNLNNDLLLLFTLQNLKNQPTIISIRLKDAVLTDWYLHYLHIIIHVAPQKIIGTLDNLKLRPIPLQFSKKHKIISIRAQDVEENTVIYVPEMEKTDFFRDNNHLRITNNFNLFKVVSERTILLINYFKEPKLATLVIKFPNNEIVLSNKSAEIDSAPNFHQRVSLWQKAFNAVVYNETGEILNAAQNFSISIYDNINSIENKIASSEEEISLRSKRSLYKPIKNSIKSLPQISGEHKIDNAVPILSQFNSDLYGNFFLGKLLCFFWGRSSCIKRMNQVEKISTQTFQTFELNDLEKSLKNLEAGKAKYGP